MTTVAEFIEKERQSKGFGSIGYFRHLLNLLDEFDGEVCSVLAGKLRGQLGSEWNRSPEKTPEQKERDQKLVDHNLGFFQELFPEELKDWIYRSFPIEEAP